MCNHTIIIIIVIIRYVDDESESKNVFFATSVLHGRIRTILSLDCWWVDVLCSDHFDCIHRV